MSASDVSTISSIVLSILSFLLAVLSIILVIITLRQNNKILSQNNRMMENTFRPYITIYMDSITLCEQSSFFILKNFGQSLGTITLFEYDPILKTLESGQERADQLINEQYDFVKGLSLAPGQSKMLLCSVTKIPYDTLRFKIGYTSSDKYYEETIALNVKNYAHIPVPRPETHIAPGYERQVHSLRELIERLI